uniref:Large ribosomal subunit protein bL21m n=1 Tax=Globodera pallida TaxID=36090 RepID=A0A183BKJ5_GLOPA
MQFWSGAFTAVYPHFVGQAEFLGYSKYFVLSLIKSTVLEPEAYDLAERRKWRQYKVIQDDVIHIEHNIPLDVGEEIILEKVLMVGGVEFTLTGRPLLDPKCVHIRATTTTSPEVQYNFRVKSVFNPVWLSQELTVVRINRIHVEKTLLGES